VLRRFVIIVIAAAGLCGPLPPAAFAAGSASPAIAGHVAGVPAAAVAAAERRTQADSAPPYVVDSAADDANDPSSGPICSTTAGTCTLRAAIEAANTAGGDQTISFAIPGSGVQQIAPLSPLPTISVPMTIDGYTQPGAQPATSSAPAQIMVAIEGPRFTNSPYQGDGLTLAPGAAGSTVRGLQVFNFFGYGIHLQAPNSQISGDLIGFDTSDQAPDVNSLGGVEIDQSSGDVIGGADPAQRDVISGNGRSGVLDSAGHDNVVMNDLIGTDSSGSSSSSPNLFGVKLLDTHNDSVLSDVLSGNSVDGMDVVGGDHALITGDKIGVDAQGETPEGNGVSGILVEDSPDVTIGGSGSAARNVVSANGAYGIDVSGSSAGARILGNNVGTDAAGTAFDSSSGVFGDPPVFGNLWEGIVVAGAPGAVIGAPGASNLVDNNDFTRNGVNDAAQIQVVGPDAAGATIQANLLGVSPWGVPFGQPDVGNSSGIVVDGAGKVLVGGPQAGDGNVVADMQYDGIVLSGVVGGALQDNVLGTDASGTKAAPDNTENSGEIDVYNSSDVLVGGQRPATPMPCASTAACPAAMRVLGPANLASAARNYGSPSGSFGLALSGGADNVIEGNLIGTDISGEKPLGNGTCGMVIGNGATGTRIGGSAPREGNVVSANGFHGIQLTDVTGTVIQGNRIGTDEAGNASLGNRGAGIAVLPKTKDTLIGGTSAGEGNLVSGAGPTGEAGIVVGTDGAAAGSVKNTVIEGNRIGTNVEGSRPIANADGGIGVFDGVSGLTIGGTELGAGNLISGNGGEGIRLHGAARRVRIFGNLIGADASGHAPLGNQGDGIGAGKAETNRVKIGGSTGRANLIAYNGINGVFVEGAQNLTVRRNSIFGNGKRGIALSAGGNDKQARPRLLGAVLTGRDRYDVSGTLTGPAGQSYTIDFYANPRADAHPGRDGKTWIGSKQVRTNGQGLAQIHFRTTASARVKVTATATDSAGDTSEFAKAVAVGGSSASHA
jgi:hypothetical protein